MPDNYKPLPYVGSPENACALACYSMVAQYFFPEVTFADVARVSRWREGYVVWEMPFWNWIMEKGVTVTAYDQIDLEAWGREGTAGLKKSVPEQEFQFYAQNTYDLVAYAEDIRQLFNDPRFTYRRQNPVWGDLQRHVADDAVCTVVLNAAALDGEKGFTLHQVAILDITDTCVIFHDPRETGEERPARQETHQHFKHAWLERVESPSLCAYKKAR